MIHAMPMRASYAVEPIGPRTTDRAYTLARVGGLAPSLEEWREFCRSVKSPTVRDGEERVVVVRNEREYIKGLCIYSIRNHFLYGRMLDVPVLIVASAADPEGVAIELAGFFRSECKRSNCLGVRFWTTQAISWARRSSLEDLNQTDQGAFLSVSASPREMEEAVRAYAIGESEATDRSSQ
jgi:hypothetical protein